MIRSPLRYPGGKSRAIARIAALVPPFKEFREPFVGGGSVFVYLKQQFPKRKFWINDAYEDLAIFWKEIQKNSREVIALVEKFKSDFKNGKELHKFLRENKESFIRAEKAAAFFVFNRISFSGTTEAGGFSSQAFEKRFTDSSIERLKKLPELLKDVKITNDDYAVLLEAEGEEVFLFLDPPYFSATDSALYGKNGKLHVAFDHERFAEALRVCRHRWLLTYDDSPYIRRLFSFANITSWKLMYGMRNQTSKSIQLGDELFISNYEFIGQKLAEPEAKSPRFLHRAKSV
jgi:DNA adenine methylase